jgi:hypothetical protein
MRPKTNTPVSDSNSVTAPKTVSGAFITTTVVPTNELPGNFGVRVLESMPTDLKEVHTEQLNNIALGFSCDERPAVVPDILEGPD